jgi:hypothetical protein
MVGRHISDELKEMALSMSLQGLRDFEVHEFTGISVQSVRRLRSTHCQIGEVSRKPIAPSQPRALTPMHRQVCFFTHSLNYCNYSHPYMIVPLRLHQMPAGLCSCRAANRTPGGLWCGGVDTNGCTFPPKGGLHHENGASQCFLLANAHTLVDHAACTGVQ